MVEESAKLARYLNPWVLHLQKFCLELKCPLCLNLLIKPMLLPCDHIFCSDCVPYLEEQQPQLECRVCKSPYVDLDKRAAPYMEKMVSIYKSMGAALQRSPQADHDGGSTDGVRQGSEGYGLSTYTNGVREKVDWGTRTRRAQYSTPDKASPYKTPSVGGTTCSEDDNNDNSIEHSLKTLQPKIKIEKDLVDKESTGINGKSVLQCEEEYLRSGKRKKSDTTSFNAQPSAASDCLSSNLDFICALCQSSEESEASGPMVHYANRKVVGLDELVQPNDIHVHMNCVDWSPRVYYEGERIVNLENEIVRGAKLKCSSCGLKGATLGCYSTKCRKSFHVPCAVNISDCRWDAVNYHVLCPTHASLRLPGEKYRSKKKPTRPPSTKKSNQKSERVWAASPGIANNWVLCTSDLSCAEMELLADFAGITGATVTETWNIKATHVIAGINEMGACKRTFKVLMAILNGRWILTIDWVNKCMEAMHPIEEEPYEVSLDVYGRRDGPKSGRLRQMNKAPKLFTDISFYLCGEFDYKEDLEDLMLDAGGMLLTESMLVSQTCDTQTVSSKTLVVLPQCQPEQLHEEAKTLAARTRSLLVDHSWIFDSIAASVLQPFLSKV
ncbi:hypothetical protein GIB67_037575 [Kingdonia uniflora]|uniref:Uncharacterized protein n=1 Tax=Kingdonia uniflora TaxID=39325 RepID=A0A7J7LSM8_9MAGN|nr:hypothetical protein GIB67_037575 [Kingdonia uniflora]